METRELLTREQVAQLLAQALRFDAKLLTLLLASCVAFVVARFSWRLNLALLGFFTAANLLPPQSLPPPLLPMVKPCPSRIWRPRVAMVSLLPRATTTSLRPSPCITSRRWTSTTIFRFKIAERINVRTDENPVVTGFFYISYSELIIRYFLVYHRSFIIHLIRNDLR